MAGSVLETYRAILAFRKATPVMAVGATRFLDLPAPLLGFWRGAAAEALLCVFNLSPAGHDVALPQALAVTGPAQSATVKGKVLTLGPNGFAYLKAEGKA